MVVDHYLDLWHLADVEFVDILLRGFIRDLFVTIIVFPIAAFFLSFCEILRERQKEFVDNNFTYQYDGIHNLNASLPKASWCQLPSLLMTLQSANSEEPSLI